MKNYIISNIWGFDEFDGFFMEIREITEVQKYTVSFLPYEEKYKNIKEDDIIKGDISINLAFLDKKTNRDIIFIQNIQKSPHIEAIVKVTKIIDNYRIYAISSIRQDEILIDFEEEVDCRVGDKILISGEISFGTD